jgi:hypothetical protein
MNPMTHENGGQTAVAAKPHLSYTQLNMLLRCGEQYRRRYIEGERVPPGSAGALGKSFHLAQESNYRQKITSKQDLPMGAVTAAFSDAFDVESKDVLWTPEEAETGIAKVKGDLKDEGVKLVEVYHTEVAPAVQPESCEEVIPVALDGFPYDLKCVVDLVDDQQIVHDSKTRGKTPTAEEANKSMQLTAYALAYRVSRKEQERGLKLDRVVRNKTPKIVTLPTQRTNEQIGRFLETMARAAEAIQGGVFLPAPEGAWYCSPKFCGYYGTCKVRPH